MKTKEEKNKYARSWYAENKERIKSKKKASRTKWRSGNTERAKDCDRKYFQNSEKYKWFITEKNNPCEYCGKKFHTYAMQFDHVKGKKSFEITTNSVKSKSFSILQTERKKCFLTCANCHFIKTGLVDRRKGKYKVQGKLEWKLYLESLTNNDK